MNQPAIILEDAESFRSLYEATYLSVFRYICARLGQAGADADDLAADTYFRAWNARRSFSGDEQAALGWLIRIAHNLVIDSYRRIKVHGEGEDIDEIQVATREASPEQHAMKKEQADRLWQMVGKLPEEQREILILRYVLDWPVKEIAAHIGILENTASQVIHRTLVKMRENWDEDV